ncbi:hypothetical protein CPB83DRAFT_851595 [Crepidotus variabilis]|uniref:Uncharacterized protein n=1 Tax=Crepidotus variabilis TaxID=179855 RepID=A0A9P6JRQ0_9AGAR|nr:hypothetical protein CPB83DRAFT_851595 [Crepidotus variabilis]
MNLKGPKEAKGARAMKGTKKPNDGESQKKALPITKPKTANANAKEADPDGKQSKFMNSWAGVKRTADEMQASGGTSNQSGKEQLSPQSNKKRKINSQNNHK